MKKRLNKQEEIALEFLIKAHSYIKKQNLSPQIIEDAKFSYMIRKIEELALSDILRGKHIHTRKFCHKCALLREAYSYYETLVETRSALALDLEVSHAQLARTASFAVEEGNAAGLNQKSKVLFIGSGPYPESAISYAKQFGCDVYCVDWSPEATALSSRIAKKLRPLRLNIIYGNGEDQDFKKFTHIALAVLTKNKDEILSKLAKEKDKTIILRTVPHSRQMIYEPVSQKAIRPFKVSSEVKGNTIMHSLILKTNSAVRLSESALGGSYNSH